MSQSCPNFLSGKETAVYQNCHLSYGMGNYIKHKIIGCHYFLQDIICDSELCQQ